MNRRKAIRGILGLTGISSISVLVAKYFTWNSSHNCKNFEDYFDLIAELVNVIIPSTPSPRDRLAKIQDYIINYMEVYSSVKEYNNFLNGLNSLRETCKNTYGVSFKNCSEVQKKELFENFDNKWYSKGLLSKINNKIRGRSFFVLLKTLTIEGYFTKPIIGISPSPYQNPSNIGHPFSGYFSSNTSTLLDANLN